MIESLVAIVLVATIILTFLGVIAYGFAQTQVNATQVQAIAVGQHYLDALRNAEESNQPLPTATALPVDQGNSFLSSVANTNSSTFSITPNTCPIVNTGTSVNQYDCVVTVSWTENNENESVKVESYVTR